MSAEKTWDCRKPLPPTWKTTPDPLGPLVAILSDVT